MSISFRISYNLLRLSINNALIESYTVLEVLTAFLHIFDHLTLERLAGFYTMH